MSVRILEIREQLFRVVVVTEDGLYISRVETEAFNASGQGETEEEALKDIKSAIELLLEDNSR